MLKYKGYKLRVKNGDYVYILPDRGSDIAKRNSSDPLGQKDILSTVQEAWENNTAFAVKVGFMSRIRGFVELDMYGTTLSVHDKEIIRA